MTDNPEYVRSPIFDLEEPLHEVRCGVDAIMLLSEGVRQQFLDSQRTGEAISFVAGCIEKAAEQAKEAFDRAFDLHVKQASRDQ